MYIILTLGRSVLALLKRVPDTEFWVFEIYVHYRDTRSNSPGSAGVPDTELWVLKIYIHYPDTRSTSPGSSQESTGHRILNPRDLCTLLWHSVEQSWLYRSTRRGTLESSRSMYIILTLGRPVLALLKAVRDTEFWVLEIYIHYPHTR